MDQPLIHKMDVHILVFITQPVIILPQIQVAEHTLTQIAQPTLERNLYVFLYVADVLLIDMEWLLTIRTSYVPNVSHMDGLYSCFCSLFHFGL